MAWYRAGGAGIPASLKSDMNDVLNKKFGTSTTYPPSDWPSDVNLLGPLPEKTASGAIASFSDGADTVPLKSLVFGIEPVQASGTPSPSNPLPISGLFIIFHIIRAFFRREKVFTAHTFFVHFSTYSACWATRHTARTVATAVFNHWFLTF